MKNKRKIIEKHIQFLWLFIFISFFVLWLNSHEMKLDGLNVVFFCLIFNFIDSIQQELVSPLVCCMRHLPSISISNTAFPWTLEGGVGLGCWVEIKAETSLHSLTLRLYGSFPRIPSNILSGSKSWFNLANTKSRMKMSES